MSEFEPKYPVDYELPHDQLMFELDLIDTFTKRHPNDVNLLADALNVLKRFAGFNIPKYPVSIQDINPEDVAEMVSGGEVDENGYLIEGSGPVTSSSLYLSNEHQQHRLSFSLFEHPGIYIVGELPEVSKDILFAVYALTGAQLTRDDRIKDIRRGVVLRAGIYMGSPIFFEETYYDSSGIGDDIDVLRVSVVSRDFYLEELDSIDEVQFEDFVESTGLDVYTVRDMQAKRQINVHNYRSLAQVLVSAGQIVADASLRY